MKKALVIFLTVFICVSFIACQYDELDPINLPSGTYYMVGDFEEYMTPYLSLNFEDHTFSMGASASISYAEHGSFVVEGTRITATSQSTVFVFEVTEKNTLILVDNGNNEYFKMSLNSEFVLQEEAA
ncbi:MAG: hypothetical protein IJW49_03670 [Clostridia bacterium]|nr:hypothetical protein [Clostridia bacterium]